MTNNPIKYEERILTDCTTGSPIKSFKEVEDGYIIDFENGYSLELDISDITLEELKYLVENKVHVRIKFRLHLWAGDLKNDEN